MRMPFAVHTTGNTCLSENMGQAAFIKALKTALKNGPVNVGIEGLCFYNFYSSGIIMDDDDAKKCYTPDAYTEIKVNHAVTMVGYGQGPETYDNGEEIPYWKILNSLSSEWGENGYFRMEQTATNGALNQVPPCWPTGVTGVTGFLTEDPRETKDTYEWHGQKEESHYTSVV